MNMYLFYESIQLRSMKNGSIYDLIFFPGSSHICLLHTSLCICCFICFLFQMLFQSLPPAPIHFCIVLEETRIFFPVKFPIAYILLIISVWWCLICSPVFMIIVCVHEFIRSCKMRQSNSIICFSFISPGYFCKEKPPSQLLLTLNSQRKGRANVYSFIFKQVQNNESIPQDPPQATHKVFVCFYF